MGYNAYALAGGIVAIIVLIVVLVAVYFEPLKRLYGQLERTRGGQTLIRAGKLSLIAAAASLTDYLYGLDHIPTKAELILAVKMIVLAAVWKFRDGVKLKQ
jgi:multisubunit Na+/H+ antiporter MnhB subunit